jgi:hypothetical protein
LLADNKLNEKASRRFDATALAAMQPDLSRARPRSRWPKRVCAGLSEPGGSQRRRTRQLLKRRLGMPAIHRAQAGLISDMDYVADALYSRAPKRKELAA